VTPMRALLVACLVVLAGCAPRRVDPVASRLTGRFPDVVLTDQDGQRVRFYSDLVRGHVVLVNFMYTTCTRKCPRVSSNLVAVQDALGPRLGQDVLMLSVSLDPARDTPPALAGYAAVLGAKPGWRFLTGTEDDVQLVRRRLGVTDPDPVIDADRTQHAGIVVYGNDATGRWSAVPGLMRPQLIADAVLRVADPLAPRAAPTLGPPCPAR